VSANKKIVELDMEYNTSQPHLIIPEYGRNIQKMIDFAIKVKDRDERNTVAKAIINVMGQLNPHLRDVTDFKHKLWDHLFIISDFKLDVDSPYPMPTRETFMSKPDRINYPKYDLRYKHYGKIIEDIIAKAKDYPEGEEKDFLVETIANHLKKSYLLWNRDSVTDEVIIEHLRELSKGKLKLNEKTRLSQTADILARNKPKTVAPSNNNKKKGQNDYGKRKRNFKK